MNITLFDSLQSDIGTVFAGYPAAEGGPVLWLMRGPEGQYG